MKRKKALEGERKLRMKATGNKNVGKYNNMKSEIIRREIQYKVIQRIASIK